MDEFAKLLDEHHGQPTSNDQNRLKRERSWEADSSERMEPRNARNQRSNDQRESRRPDPEPRYRDSRRDYRDSRRDYFRDSRRDHRDQRNGYRDSRNDYRDSRYDCRDSRNEFGRREGRDSRSERGNRERSVGRRNGEGNKFTRHAWSPEKLAQVKGKALVIIPSGDGSLHDDAEFKWHGRSEYDLCIVYYGSNEEVKEKFKGQCKFFFEKKGPKWQLVRHALKSLKEWKSYEYIWLPDDDLKMDSNLIVKMFQIASEHSILLGQPALFDKNVQRQYRDVLIYREDLLLHYTNFVEIMAPFLRVDFLEYVFHTMDSDECKSGWGLDMLWPTMLNFMHIAVIDSTPMLHTRPQNAFSVDNSFYRMYNIDPQRECHDLMMKFRFRGFPKRRFKEILLPQPVQEVEPVESADAEKVDVASP